MRGSEDELRKKMIKREEDRAMSGNIQSVLTSDSDSIVAEQRVALFVSAGVDTRVVVRDIVDVQHLVAQPCTVAREHNVAVFLPRDRHQEVGRITRKIQRFPHG